MDTADLTDPQVEALRERVKLLRSKGWRDLHARTGVPVSTIRKFVYREVNVPLLSTYKAIEAGLAAMERRAKRVRS